MPENSMVRSPATSFIVRLWKDTDDAQLRGEVEHIGSGEKRFFADAWTLLSLIEAWQRDLARDAEAVR